MVVLLAKLKQEFIGDIIQYKQIKSWDIGDTIYISGPTGSGKSFFVTSYLASHCRQENKKILWISNRELLKNQNVKASATNTDIITTMNYQKIESYILDHKRPIHFDYIVADECHYFFSDAAFNQKTDLTFKWLMSRKDCVKILCSATGNLTETYLQHMGVDIIKYELQQDYNYINNFYFYDKDKVITNMLSELPADEKAIYFTSAKKAYDTSELLKNIEIDASFICSKNKSNYKTYSNNEIKEYIIQNEMFDCQVLCTTSVLDNGVNIKDKAVKHIIIDYFDLDTVQQCFGRKRILDDSESINIYIKNRRNKSLNGTKRDYIKKIEQVEYLKENGQVKFIDNYKKKHYSNMIDIVNDKNDLAKVRHNKMMYYKCKCELSAIEEMMATKDGYVQAVLERFDWQAKKYKILDNEIDSITINDWLNKHIDKKMFKDKQKEFKKFLLEQLLNAPKASHGKLGLKSINALFDDNGLNYTLSSKEENSRKSENWKKTYWIISKS